MNYRWLSPRSVIFGWGIRTSLAEQITPLGNRVFVVTGSRKLSADGTFDAIFNSLADAGLTVTPLGRADGEPTVEQVDRMTRRIRDHRPSEGDVLLGLGGGSALDLAKAVAGMARQSGRIGVRAFLEGVGTGRTLSKPVPPIIAVPTTAGTGTEATKNAVISGGGPSTEYPPFKKSLRSELLLPTVAVVDPELTTSLPLNVTARTGMDALTQLLESYLSKRRQPLAIAMARAGLEGIFPALGRLANGGNEPTDREIVSHGALLSGMALANSGLGMAHGVAAALGVRHGVPHGTACATMLPTALRVNADACRDLLGELSQQLFDDPDPSRIGVEVEQLIEAFGLPRRLSELGVTREDLEPLATASRGNSMNGNPVELSDSELITILEEGL